MKTYRIVVIDSQDQLHRIPQKIYNDFTNKKIPLPAFAGGTIRMALAMGVSAGKKLVNISRIDFSSIEIDNKGFFVEPPTDDRPFVPGIEYIEDFRVNDSVDTNTWSPTPEIKKRVANFLISPSASSPKPIKKRRPTHLRLLPHSS